MKPRLSLCALRLAILCAFVICPVTLGHTLSTTAPSPADTPRSAVASGSSGASQSSSSAEPWSRYFAKVEPTLHRGGPGLPGRILGQEGSDTAERLRAFAWAWRYRPMTYELHYANGRDLARAAYGLALHSGDIDPGMTLARLSSVARSHHYTMTQVCDWLNAAFAGRFKPLSQEELVLVGFLVQDGALRVQNGEFVPAGLITHILAAAPGKKQGFGQNLEHERLHVFWEQSAPFRNAATQRWRTLSESESNRVREELAHYSGTEARLIEEWAIREAEAGRLSPEETENL